MKLLVFGSNGLVGSSLRRIFGKNNYFKNVHFSTRKDTNLFNYKETSNIISDFRPDFIINAAAKVGGIYANNTERSEFLLENIKININILESILPFNEIKLINLGSSCIYPLNAPNPISEKSFMTGILEPTNSPYAMAKLTAIELGNSLRQQYGHSVVNLMPTNLYGPNDNFSDQSSHVIPGLIKRMHDAKNAHSGTFAIWGSGKPLREFLHVDDLALSIRFIIENKIDDNLINIGSGEEVSIFELAKKIKNIVEFKGELVFDDTKPDGNPRKLLDSTLIKSHGWIPTIKLEEGLNSTYQWYLETYKFKSFPK
jgi:GDP-L-fucose synthase